MTARSEVAAERSALLQNAQSALLTPATALIEPQQTTAHRLAELLTRPELLLPPPVVLPYFALKGRVTLLSGREKVGKSTLLAGVVAEASRGRPVFDIPVECSVTVLWYCIDEPLGDLVRRLELYGADPRHIIINQAPRTMAQLRLAIETDLRAFPDVQVIVVDTLSKVFAASAIKRTDPDGVEPQMVGLVDHLRQFDVGSIFSYHTNKQGREYSGSVAIGANVDEIITLRKRDNGEDDDFDDDGDDDGRRLLVQEGRSLRGRVQLTFKDGRYELLDLNASLADRLLDTLADLGTATRSGLVKAAGVNKSHGLKLVKGLLAEGAIHEDGGTLRPSRRNGSSGTPSRTMPEPMLEPALHLVGSSGSTRFPERGTESEPLVEPAEPELWPTVPESVDPTLPNAEPQNSPIPIRPY